jgi:hypothetical protein
MKLRFTLILLMLLGGWFLTPGHAQAPMPTTTTVTTTTVKPVAATVAMTTTTTLPTHVHPECVGWLALAVSLGWHTDNLGMLERVMWKESRCQPHQLNASDPNGGSLGLTQVNKFWCLPSRYYPNGYLQTYGILNTCEELYRPEVNLVAALAIFEYAKGWSQWGL